MSKTETPKADEVTVRCGFCLTLNAVDLAKAADRPVCGDCEKSILLDRPVKVTDEDFERTVLGSGPPVLVDFYADRCGPCKMVAPLVDEIAQDNIGKLLVAKIDADQAPGLLERFGIRGIPTVILFKGGEEVARSVGLEPDKLRSMTEQAVG